MIGCCLYKQFSSTKLDSYDIRVLLSVTLIVIKLRALYIGNRNNIQYKTYKVYLFNGKGLFGSIL